MTLMDRRAFIARGIAATGGGALSAVALERLGTRAALADKGHHGHSSYGEPQPVPDQRGSEVLALPAGFSYVTFGETASTMTDGNRPRSRSTGWRRSPGRRHRAPGPQPRGPQQPGWAPCAAGPEAYDPRAGGGTTTLDYDPSSRTSCATSSPCRAPRQLRRRLLAHRQELDHREERVVRPGSQPATCIPGAPRLLFEVPSATAGRTREKGEPLRAMGRFSHEALAVDQRSGVVYQTEDPGSGRARASTASSPRTARPDKGGRLQILGSAGVRSTTRARTSGRGRPLPSTGSTSPTPIPTT